MSKGIRHGLAPTDGPQYIRSGLVDRGIRVGRREGVALTLAVEAVAVAVAALMLPEVRGKIQETCADVQRRTRDASFRLRHRGNAVADSGVSKA